MPDTTPATPTCFVGCDVGKTEIVVFNSGSGRTSRIPNSPERLARFADSLDPGCLVICEPTGGWEAGLLDALTRAGRAVHRADAVRVKAFIRSLGTLGKSDAIDARALAAYGRERHATLTLWQPKDELRDRLHRLVMLRRDLIADRTAWSNRRGAPTGAALADHLGPILDCLEARIAAVDAEIAHLIKATPALRADARALRQIKGIGPHTATGLIALMPELGQITRREAAALAGVAPHPNESGASRGYRRARGGRPEIKRTLFFAAMSAARHNPPLRAFHQRLRDAGKPKLLAIVAVMRKLIVIANAVLRDTRNGSSLVRP